MIRKFRDSVRFNRRDVAIDLGTANALIHVRGRGIVLNEPTVVAVRHSARGGKRIEAVGTDAKRMLGRSPDDITVIRPLKDGVIADFMVTEKMLQHFIRKAVGRRGLWAGTRVLVSVPYGATPVERRAIRESAHSAGARRVYLADEPLAAAVGAGVQVDEPRGAMVVDIGGGTAEVALISLSGIVYAESVRIGGDHLNDAIIAYVRRQYNMLIGEVTAEHIKHTVATAYPGREVRELEVTGRHLSAGVPRRFTLNSNEILEALQSELGEIVAAIKNALEKIPPDLGSDVAERGIMLTGGGALLDGLDTLIGEETGLPVITADDPLTCLVRGGGKLLEDMAALDASALGGQ